MIYLFLFLYVGLSLYINIKHSDRIIAYIDKKKKEKDDQKKEKETAKIPELRKTITIEIENLCQGTDRMFND